MSTFPITVRQLEAIVRISESLAKMRLQSVAGVQAVEEAIRLFKLSTLDAASTGNLATQESLTPEMAEQVARCEMLMGQRLPFGHREQRASMEAYLGEMGFEEFIVRLAISAVVQRDEYSLVEGRQMLVHQRRAHA
eukprot:c41858_g1_i1.p2 GENE.c41858_g1_i1~~c41858_g1_i1.p2  ORF type:complete len:160 (+),score=34.17 c41858_g1_i1:75-482(+)